jgi:ABC-type protease/lipase transport system fused ATPase/permease subunit
LIVFDEVRRRCRRAIAYPAAFSLVLNVLALTIPLYMMQVYDRVLGSRSTDTLFFLTLIAIVALLAFAALDWVRARMLVRIGNWFDRTLSPEAVARALEAQLQGYAYRSEALQDIGQIRGFLSGPTLLCFFDAPWTPIYLLVIFLLHPALGAVALVGTLVLLGLAVVNEITTRERLEKAGWTQITNARSAEDALRNAEVIDAMGMFGPIVSRWQHQTGQVIHDQQVASDRGGVIASTSRFVRLALQMGMLGLGAWLVLDHDMACSSAIP